MKKIPYKEFEKVKYYSGKGCLMILDILGLDSLYGKYQSKILFNNFYTLDEQIKDVITKRSGVYNGNLRSGLEILFGILKDTNDDDDDKKFIHTKTAFECAVHIQKINSQLIVQADRDKHPVFSLRIGMHSAHYNVGIAQNKSEQFMCILSQGYMITKSLNQSCDINSILYSSETAKILNRIKLETDYSNGRNIKVLGRSEKIMCFDHDPLKEHPETKRLAHKALQQIEKRKLENERFNCEIDQNVKIQSNKGNFDLLNFSRGGLAIRGSTNLKVGQSISVKYIFIDSDISNLYTKQIENSSYLCEVVWENQEKIYQNIGLKYIKTTEKQKEKLLNFLYNNLEIS